MNEEHPCFGFISLSLTILELSKKRHYFSALPSMKYVAVEFGICLFWRFHIWQLCFHYPTIPVGCLLALSAEASYKLRTVSIAPQIRTGRWWRRPTLQLPYRTSRWQQ